MPIRVLLVDDHLMLRAGVRELLGEEAGIEVVAEAGDGQTAVRLAAELAPDVAVMDLRLPDMSGIEAAAQIRGRSPNTQVIMMSAYADSSTAASVTAAGALGFVPKDEAFEELANAVRMVAAGRVYQSPSLAHP